MKLEQAVVAAREQHRAGGGAVLDILLGASGLAQDELARQLADVAGVEVVDATATGLQADFTRLDLESARRWRCVALLDGPNLLLAAEDPWDEQLIQRVARMAGIQPRPVAVSRSVLARWLAIDEQLTSATPAKGAVASADGPIVQFVDQAIRAGYAAGASDIHFECDRAGVTAKHRLDGVMAHHARLDSVQGAQEAISRIKVLAQLDITERRLPQDGRMRLELGGREVDVRVSIMPSVHGEDAVLRLLDKARLRAGEKAVSLPLLGFEHETTAVIREVAGMPSGLLLVTGPTGSGKTTTVYAALAEMNTGLEKIITIEDPVEYELAGVLQIPVNERKGLTFARGLRSILRHDPDRILVGEIRDAETAEIAVQSALTGHLVFTTVHANSFSDVVGRFRHFGLDMFGFMSALNGVVVQRLLRQVCPDCRTLRPATPAESHWLRSSGVEVAEGVPQAVGCPACHGSGYRGRFVLAEVHQLDDEVRDDVTQGAALSVLKGHAQRQGIVPLAKQAAMAVANARTTPEEVKRVVGWK